MRVVYRVSQIIAFCCSQGFCCQRVFGVRHVPRSGAVLLASNHQSFLDPILLTNALPRECHYMARDTLFRNKHFARIIRMYNSFPIKRGKADLAGVKETLRRLKAGVLVLTFPEGTRSPDGRVFPFHPGVFAIARKARVPIVPAAIEGAHEAWPRGAKLPRPARVWVEYGQPIPVDVIRGTDARQATKDLTAQVRTLHNNLRRRIGRKPFDYGEEMENGKWKMENGK